MNIQIFFVQAIWQNSSKPLILKGFYLLRMSDDYCFRRLRKDNCRNGRSVATVLRAMVKSHKSLKETKVFVCGLSGRNLNFFSTFAGKCVLESFYCNVAACNLTKDYSVNFIKKETLTRRLLHNYFLCILKKIWTRLLTPLLDCLWNGVK